MLPSRQHPCLGTVPIVGYSICAYRGAIRNIKFSSMTLLDLYKLPDLDKRAGSCAVSVCIYPVSGQRAIQLVQSVNEVR
jgi:hypothetical protein